MTQNATKANGLDYVTANLVLVRVGDDGEEVKLGPEYEVAAPLKLGCVLTDDGTAAGEVSAIEERCFERCNELLEGWAATHEGVFPATSTRPLSETLGSIDSPA